MPVVRPGWASQPGLERDRRQLLGGLGARFTDDTALDSLYVPQCACLINWRFPNTQGTTQDGKSTSAPFFAAICGAKCQARGKSWGNRRKFNQMIDRGSLSLSGGLGELCTCQIRPSFPTCSYGRSQPRESYACGSRAWTSNACII